MSVLGTLNPLGERSRNSKWKVTIAAYLVGSSSGGVILGGLLGWIGTLVWPSHDDAPVLSVMVIFLTIGLVLDLYVLGARLPTTRRQVNDLWLQTYRGWVYGFGFGFQLGAGVVTIVRTSAVYASFLASFLTGSWLRGALIGGVFGVVRGSTLFLAAGVADQRRLMAVDRLLVKWEPAAQRVGNIAKGVTVLVLGAILLIPILAH